MNIQGLMDEYESARIAVAALAEALERAGRFNDRFSAPGIRMALAEAETALIDLSIELINAIDEQFQETA